MWRGPVFEVPGLLRPFDLEPRQLLELIESKAPRAIGNWRQLGAEEYGRFFAVAQTAGYDIIRDIYEGLLEVLREPGATDQDFQERLLPILRAKGWLPQEGERRLATRLQLIFDTNLRTGQAIGRWGRIQKTKLALPYLLAFTAKDERVRRPPKSESDHRAFEGILLPVDHPFWASYFPPLGFRCRCSVVQKSRSQFARLNRPVTSEAELQERISRLGPAWGFNPGAPHFQQIERAAERANERRLEGLAPIEPARAAQEGASAWASIID